MQLTELSCSFSGGGNFAEIGNDAGWLSVGIILTERYEIVVLFTHEFANVFCCAGQSVIGGNGD